MGPRHGFRSQSERPYVSFPSRLLLLVLFAGGLQSAALTNGIDRAPRRVRAGTCVSSSGSTQRLARGSGQGSGLAPDALIGSDTGRTRFTAASGGDTAPHVAIAGADLAALPVLADAGVALDRIAPRLLSVSTAASSRGPPTA